jgi:hypothetical protein
VSGALDWFGAEGTRCTTAEPIELKQHEVEGVIRAQLSHLKMASGKTFAADVADDLSASTEGTQCSPATVVSTPCVCVLSVEDISTCT